ncbi:hypothetical protein [Actinoplanes palleronii]|uniref:Leucine rich repeat (LRR) protein n=1 Tax=Actinoplanes palleronii TaxID=113570 RepID=A0ABQ4BMX3_9ACTN|nr:hypothetical protein [Actinoplanes palleronii]GIE72031.1 hypothetical protein Apa02nite_081390 [Actinoplanes palleronii]
MLRLIAEHGGAAADGLAEREPLSATAVTAMAGHPDPWVRAALAGNRSIAAEIRLRLHDDPDPLVRQRIQNVRDLPRPESALSRILERYLSWSERGMLTDEELIGELMEEATRDPLAHPLPAVRRAFAGRRQLTAAQAVRLGADPDPSVRTAVSLHPVLTEEQLSAIDIDPGSAGSDRHSSRSGPAGRPAHRSGRAGPPSCGTVPAAPGGPDRRPARRP